MAKYSQASETIEKIVNDISNELGLVHMGIDFQPLCVSKAKEVCKIVKANELAEYISKRDDLLFVLCFEEAFDQVDDETKYMWLRMEMEKVSFDSEKDKVNLGCPSFTIPIGFYDKYKSKAIDAALLGHYTIAQIEDRRKQAEAEKKAERMRKRKNKQNAE